MASPPAALTAFRPSAPWAPVPERIMQIAQQNGIQNKDIVRKGYKTRNLGRSRP